MRAVYPPPTPVVVDGIWCHISRMLMVVLLAELVRSSYYEPIGQK